MDAMEECDLFLVNRDTLSRVGEGGRRNSNLDLGFCSEVLLDVVEYSQKDDTWGSDHFPIEFDVGMELKTYRKKTNRISTKRTDWDMYTQNLKEKEGDLDKEEYKEMNASDKYKKVIRDIKDSVREATYDNGKQTTEMRKRNDNVVTSELIKF